ncbi:MAG: NTP transferase domain-containing protein [Vicinamibacterales bacterium]
MSRETRVLQTVILAAGSGTRLAPTRGDVPKPLMTVNGVPLIAHALSHAEKAGCQEAVVVLGYEAERVRAAIDALNSPIAMRFEYTADFTAPNGLSLLAAEASTQQFFYLQMVDHLFVEPVLGRLAEQPFEDGIAGRVLIDSRPSAEIDLEDATKVCLADARVTAIGKGLAEWDAVDAGCFVLSHEIFDALRDVRPPEGLTVSSGMRRLVERGRLGSVDIVGAAWIDVDTPVDRERAERMLERTQPSTSRV